MPWSIDTDRLAFFKMFRGLQMRKREDDAKELVWRIAWRRVRWRPVLLDPA